VADFGGLKKGVGLLKISDFGAAVLGNVSTPHCHDIQPDQFCAPEVLLKAGWTYSADIWNLGTVVSAFGFETTIRAVSLTSTSWHSCGSF
jgi:serine/threonine-protein kinase SRPK3